MRAPVLRRLLRHPGGRVGVVLVGAVVAAALLAPLAAPYAPDRIDMDASLQGPSAAHPLGTDAFGRDVWSRLLYGARFSLGVSVVSRLVAIGLGTLLGLAAGYLGGRTDHAVMRLADVTMAYPGILLLVAVMAAVGPGRGALAVALGVVGWAAVARLVRAEVLSLREREFVTAARSLGVSTPMILFRHILPNCRAQLMVVFSMGLGAAIMAESSVSFLGLGAQPPTPSWGTMISAGLDYLRTAPWLSLAPGIAITLAVLGFNLLGDAVRDVLDPTQAGGGRRAR